MSATPLDPYLALPLEQRRILDLMVVLHAPLDRTALAEWLHIADIRDPKRRQYSTKSLVPMLEAWRAAGLVVGGHGANGPTDQHRAAPSLGHAILERDGDTGALRPLVDMVRRHAPLLEKYQYSVDAERLYRELLLSLYLPASDDLNIALERYEYRFRSKSAEAFVFAWGFDPPASRLTLVEPSRLEPYLSRVFELAWWLSGPVGPGPAAALREVRGLSERPFVEAAVYHALRAETSAATELLVGRTGPEVAAARCILLLVQGELAGAREAARAAIELTRAKKSKKVKGLLHSLWGWVTLALLTDADSPISSALAREQLEAVLGRHYDHGTASAIASLNRFLSAPEVAEQPHFGAAYSTADMWSERLLWLLALRFAGKNCPKALAGALSQDLVRAEQTGFSWLAAELRRALDAKSSGGLLALHRIEEPWQRAVRALESAVALAAQTDGAEDSSEERLVWILSLAAQGSYELTARIQTRTANGFSSGRQVTWKRLYEAAADAPFLSDDDRRVVRHVRVEKDRGFYGAGAAYVLDEEALLKLVGHPRVFLAQDCQRPVEVVRGGVRLEVSEVGEDIRVSLSPQGCLERGVLCERDGDGRVLVYALSKAQRIIATQLPKKGLELPAAARGSVQRALGQLVRYFPVASEVGVDAEHIEEVAADPRVHLLLRRAAAGLLLRTCVEPLGTTPQFVPGEGSASVLSTREAEQGLKTVRCLRDLADERARLLQVIEQCPTLARCEFDGREYRLATLSECLELLCELRALDDQVVVKWPEGQALTLVGARELRDLRLRITSAESWFSADGELQVDNDLKLSLRQLLDRAGQQSRFVALGDERFLALSEELRRTLEGMAALSQVRSGGVEIHPLALFGLQSLADAQLENDPVVAARLARAREAVTLVPKVPGAFEASLRSYQEEGYAWLTRLAHWGAGACLADDMGLGKTLQALALLVAQAPSGPSLVVAPMSVCANWLDEARRFAPTLRMTRLGAGAGDRERVLSELGPFDVAVCSYGILQQECDLLSKIHFRVVVLDEAQAIKNASTQRSKAAYRLAGEVRIALTGTPVENHLGELWSIMSFLNPGLLGSAKSFEDRFAKPIQRDGDKQAAQLLKRLVKPFILRRRKSEVLQELPDKTVITLRVEPSAEEAALFQALREQAIARMTDQSKPAEARMRLLAELTRLRRAACHPELVAPDARVSSSKLATLQALLEELREGGHRALVFSQFVDYLSIVRKELDAAGVSYQYLDGSCSAQARARAVNEFQAGQGEVFLISLKAGGFGLNLTAADYVIHLDPWWNPAVEDQASDRAHRMGQTRPVTIYRLVMQGSIEEKILALHAEKRDLADQLLEGTGTMGAPSIDELMGLLSEVNETPIAAPPPGSARRARALVDIV